MENSNKEIKRFALIGNPNSGKTTLFNSLTGSTAHVGNWPGVTVEKKDGYYKKGKEKISLTDLPGIYSLSPYTDEEVVSRNFIIDGNPDCIIDVVDATNLERNLYLTSQLIETGIPLVVALNMMDVIKKDGIEIDIKTLEERMKVKIVEVSALKEENLDLLIKEAIEVSNKKVEQTTIIDNASILPLIEKITSKYEELKVQGPLFHAIKMIEGDELETKNHPELATLAKEYKDSHKDEIFDDDYESLIADARYKWSEKILDGVLTRTKEISEKPSKSEKIDKVLTHKWFGIPIFIVILFFIFHFTFSEDLFYLNALGAFGSEGIVSFEGSIFEGLFASGGINSIGVIFKNLIESVTSWFIEVVRGWLSAPNISPWVGAFIADGVLSGLSAILSFLPQILVLFFFLSLLEDSGYIARVAFNLDRIFKKLGLSGRALMPLILGFGCSVPAMMATRTLVDDKEKLSVIRSIPFFSCSAKLPILTAIAGGIVSYFHIGNADLITLGMYLLGMVTAIVCVILMRRTTLRGDVSPFILELPEYRLPQFKSIMIHLFDKAKHFIKKAFTIILASTIVIWFMNHFTWDWQFLSDESSANSILASLGKFIQPIFTPLGFGSQLTSAGWVFSVAAITGLIAKENVVSTIGTLASAVVVGFNAELAGNGAASIEAMIQATGINVPALISFIAFNMLTIPCFAAVATAKGELSKKNFYFTILFWIVTSYFVSSMIYVIGSYWWTCFIYIVLIALAILLSSLYKKKHPLRRKA